MRPGDPDYAKWMLRGLFVIVVGLCVLAIVLEGI